ncbi:hypothetical protein Hdeb2414_s0005g00180751 [Helianthus debilis subsp. tardiflorus]
MTRFLRSPAVLTFADQPLPSPMARNSSFSREVFKTFNLCLNESCFDKSKGKDYRGKVT